MIHNRDEVPVTAMDDATRRLADGALHPPFLYAMGPDDARLALDLMQAPPEVPADLEHRVIEITTGREAMPVHLVIPRGAVSAPIILYAHGGGWVLGGWSSHHRLATTLSRETGAIVVMPEYDRVPEARYPVAITQLATTLAAIRSGTLPIPGDPHRIALLGDCAGATLALSLALLDRPTPLVAQVLLYPIARPAPGDRSASDFATGAALRLADVRRLCHEYAPRGEALADPIGTPDPTGLPPTLLITAEADVTRDRSEDFGNRLRTAGVPVTVTRYLGAVHDFAVLDALRWTSPARTAITQITDYLRTAFTTPPEETAFTTLPEKTAFTTLPEVTAFISRPEMTEAEETGRIAGQA
ncbi:esterase [Actinoplanes palleronii]|uniref:Esterase n=2 Tax=Actinoplanes palleronii TaxID=113570 RepID=A0ABQ4BR12_9ACTN|nr:esterase [Actinoplanes palleronii]